jgi:REP element-mobilizing transposase RayT
MTYLKGDTARAFFATFPVLRANLQGGHLWQEGYYAVAIVSYQQYQATAGCVRNNLAQPELVAPWPTLGVVES